jgi:phospho-N-acetylmuramoyl-pentapeptide-transferase
MTLTGGDDSGLIALWQAASAMARAEVLACLVGQVEAGDTGQHDSAALAAALASKANTPTMGGVLMAGAILVSTLLLADLRSSYVQLALVLTLWLGIVGGVDDWLKLTASSRPGGSRQGLHSWEKLVFQLGIGLIVGYFAYHAGYSAERESLAHVLNLPFQKTYENPTAAISESLIYFSLPVYVVVMTLMTAGMSNAVNISDGMDGLAGGISGLVALGMMVLALVAGWQQAAQYLLVPYVPRSEELAVLAAAMAGGCVGFLWVNCSPAQVFMGDTGALALGGLLGYIAMITRQEILLLLMSVVFLIEIGSVTLQVGYFKLSGGKRIFRVAPYHHHLHLGGWTEQQVVVRFWIISLLMVVLALVSVKVR